MLVRTHNSEKRYIYLSPFVDGLDNENSAKHVGVTTEVFGSAVHYDIGAPFERIGQRRRAKCCVDAQFSAYGVYLGTDLLWLISYDGIQ